MRNAQLSSSRAGSVMVSRMPLTSNTQVPSRTTAWTCGERSERLRSSGQANEPKTQT